MSLAKQAEFRVLTRSEVFNGTDTNVEVVLVESNADPNVTPISMILRSLGGADAESFVTGQIVIVTIGAVIKSSSEPLQTLTEVPEQPGLITRALTYLGFDMKK